MKNQFTAEQIAPFFGMYLGQKVQVTACFEDADTKQSINVPLERTLSAVHADGNVELSGGQFEGNYPKLLLRPLSTMSPEEMIGLLQSNVPKDMEDRPSDDEYDVEMFYNDGACMVDGDVAVGCNFSCRCLVAQIAIVHDGSINLYNEGGELDRFPNQPQAFLYLLSKGFDLFRLIDAGLAIDATVKTEAGHE